MYLSRASQSSAVVWDSEQFMGDITGWRVMSFTLNLPGLGPNASSTFMKECGGLKIGVWANNVGGTDVVAIGSGGRVEWARSYEVDCWERDEAAGGDLLLLRSPNDGSSAGRYLRLNPSNGDILSSYQVQHGLQGLFDVNNVAVFPATGAALTALRGSSQNVLVAQSDAGSLPLAWRLQSAFQSSFVNLSGNGALAFLADSAGRSMWVAGEAVAAAQSTLGCLSPVPVTPLFVRSVPLTASSQVTLWPDLQVASGAAPSLQPYTVQALDWVQPCLLEEVQPLSPCVPLANLSHRSSASRAEAEQQKARKAQDRRKGVSRR